MARQTKDVRLHINALGLPSRPLVFTQDELLTPAAFARGAKKWEIRVDEAGLRALHEARHLLPLFRVADDPVPGRAISVPRPALGSSMRKWVLEAAAQGRLRDPALEGYCIECVDMPSRRRVADQSLGGFVYSSWQLLDLPDLRDVLSGLRVVRPSVDGFSRGRLKAESPWSSRPARVRRARTVVLAALCSRYLPELLGRIKLPPGEDHARIEEERRQGDVTGLLSMAAVDGSDLYSLAEELLFRAYVDDPLARWLPLVRHASPEAWQRLQGPALAAVWQRLGAELLLRAHEELAASSAIEPLPESSGTRVWHPLRDRLAGPALDQEPLDSVLARFGLSPHPRLLLLVEGDNDAMHIRRLLALFASETTDFVRVQTLGGSRTNPLLLARYAVSPKLGSEGRDGWELAVPPTALFIISDPENRWSTAEKRGNEERRLKAQIRRDVEAQGGHIDDDTLDLLVRIETWDDTYYELANFSDEELLNAIEVLAMRNGVSGASTDAWHQKVRKDLEEARNQPSNLNNVLHHARATKHHLAEELWPKLATKAIAEVDSGVVTPVVGVVLRAIELAGRIQRRGTVILPSPRQAISPQDVRTEER
jgi:hypothetical protein